MMKRVLLILLAFTYFIADICAQDFENDKFRIKNIGTYANTKYSDYGPVITADESVLYFTSKRPLSEKGKKREKEEYENIYRIEKKGRSFKTSTIMPFPINKGNKNNSILGLSNDGQIMLLYGDTLVNNEFNGDIYESSLDGENWTEPAILGNPISLPESHESSASIAPDGKTIYFVSDRDGGIGKRDIYRCSKDVNGDWGKVENLGEVINTLEDEEAVYIHPDGRTLYFSSKGHESTGGYDIFYSVYEEGNWTTPVNIGAPIKDRKSTRLNSSHLVIRMPSSA